MEDVCDNLDGVGIVGGATAVGGGGGASLHAGPSSSSNHRRRQNLRRRPRTLSRQMAELNMDQSEEDELLRVTREDPFLSVASAGRDRFVPSPAPNGGGLSPATMLARPSPHHPPPLPPELAAAVASSASAIPAISSSSAAAASSSSYHASSAINNATGGIMLANLGTISSQANPGSLMTTFADVEASLAATGSAAATSLVAAAAAPTVTSASNPAASTSATPKQINFTSLTTIPENPSESRNTSMVSQDSWQNFSQLSGLGPRDRVGDARANANYCSNQSLDMVDAIHDHEVAAVTAAAAARTSTSSNMTSASGFHTTAGIGGEGGAGGGGGGLLGGNGGGRGANSRAVMQPQQRPQQLQQQHKPQQRPQQLDTSGKATHPAVTSSGMATSKHGATPKQSQSSTSASAAAGAGSMMLWKKVQQTVVFGGSFITQQGKGGGHLDHQHH